ncbi:MAG: CDP-alcohol phosphatidyltransferase family protein [Nanoarchaeota archaeon]|nr:CDP-alcohol phosphatidyltransferase family protein [Nanoarchaeota archaeon]
MFSPLKKLMPSIKELKKICLDPQDINNPKSIIQEKIPRIFSIRITKLLLYTPITANHITLIMIFWGFITAFLFSTGSYWYMLAGAIVLEFLIILDCIDGELARYKKIFSLNGIFLDLVAHVTNVAVPFIGLTLGLYKLYPSNYIILAGFSASVFSILCLDIQALKHHVVIREIIKYANKIEQTTSKKIHKNTAKISKKNILKSISQGINWLYQGLNIIQVFLLGAIFNKLHWVLFFYGLTFPLMWLIKLIHEYRVGYKPYEYLFEPYKK